MKTERRWAEILSKTVTGRAVMKYKQHPVIWRWIKYGMEIGMWLEKERKK